MSCLVPDLLRYLLGTILLYFCITTTYAGLPVGWCSDWLPLLQQPPFNTEANSTHIVASCQNSYSMVLLQSCNRTVLNITCEDPKVGGVTGSPVMTSTTTVTNVTLDLPPLEEEPEEYVRVRRIVWPPEEAPKAKEVGGSLAIILMSTVAGALLILDVPSWKGQILNFFRNLNLIK